MLVQAFSSQSIGGQHIVARPLRVLVTNTRSLHGDAGFPSEIQTRDKDDKLTTFRGKKFPDFESAYHRKGTGGRCSYNGLTATIFGLNSLVGKALSARLAKKGTQLVIPYRGSRYFEEKFKIAGDLGQIYFHKFNLKDENSLYEGMRYSNVVINLIGKSNETRNFSFDEVHVEGPRRMARIARELGIKKFIHFSAINAHPNPTPVVTRKGSGFLKSKYYGELAVREEFPDAIILRPSDIIGEKDTFMNHFNSYARNKMGYNLSIWDYYHEVEKQPVYLDDVVQSVEKAILDDSANGKTFQAVGPYRYNFYDLIEYMRTCSGRSSDHDGFRIKNLRYDTIMRVMITLAGYLRKYPFCTWDRIERESISDFIDPKFPTIEDLGVKPTDLEPMIQYLGFYIPRMHRVEIPYESAPIFDTPQRLNVDSNGGRIKYSGSPPGQPLAEPNLAF